MKVNRFMLFVGAVFALVGGGANFALNAFLAPEPDMILAAREDLLAGTRLSDIPDALLVMVPIQLKPAAKPLMASLMTPEDLERMRASDGVLIQDVLKYEPILLSAVVAADNPAAARLARLGLDDPDQMLVVVSTKRTAPESVSVGDRVDLAVAVDQVRDPVVLDPAERFPSPPGSDTFFYPAGASPQDLLEALASESGVDLYLSRETPTAVPTPTPLPGIREPLAKVLVHGAPVVRVIRERSVNSFTSQGEVNVELGEILALEVIIPREAFEMVTMASTAGILQIGVLSPLAEAESDGPTLGASLQDLLDLFYADREMLLGKMSADATVPDAATPTATVTSTAIPTPIP